MVWARWVSGMLGAVGFAAALVIFFSPVETTVFLGGSAVCGGSGTDTLEDALRDDDEHEYANTVDKVCDDLTGARNERAFLVLAAAAIVTAAGLGLARYLEGDVEPARPAPPRRPPYPTV